MKKLVLSVATIALISTSAIASCGGFGDKRMEHKQGVFKACGGEKFSTSKSCKMKRDGMNFMKALGELDLSDKQEISIREAIKKYKRATEDARDKIMDNMSMANYFTKDNFDKEKFIKDKQDHRELMKSTMHKLKADFYENIYSILTKKQKEEFVKNLKS
jgi:Spy/CpxP family protein refolding chaperone